MKQLNHPKEVAEKSLFNIVKMDNFLQQETLDREFIAKAFFLPREILHSGRWKVENIRVCSGNEWQHSEKWVRKQGAHVSYDPNSEEIIKAARFVGVSLRKHCLTGEIFIVVKLWYGEADSSGHQLFAPRKKVQVLKRTKEPMAAIDQASDTKARKELG